MRELTLTPALLATLQAHYYGVRELVEAVVPKVITCRYGHNPPLLRLLRERGVLG